MDWFKHSPFSPFADLLLPLQLLLWEAPRGEGSIFQSCLLCFFTHPKAAQPSGAAIPTPLQSALMFLPRAVHQVVLCREGSPELRCYLVIAKGFTPSSTRVPEFFLQCSFLLTKSSFCRSCHQDCLLTHVSHKLLLASSCGLLCIHSELLSSLFPGAFWACNAHKKIKVLELLAGAADVVSCEEVNHCTWVCPLGSNIHKSGIWFQMLFPWTGQSTDYLNLPFMHLREDSQPGAHGVSLSIHPPLSLLCFFVWWTILMSYVIAPGHPPSLINKHGFSTGLVSIFRIQKALLALWVWWEEQRSLVVLRTADLAVACKKKLLSSFQNGLLLNWCEPFWPTDCFGWRLVKDGSWKRKKEGQPHDRKKDVP